MIDISICIPTFERSHLIERTLSSLAESLRKSQKKFQVEVVVTDNSSDEKTELVVKRYYSSLDIMYHRHQKNIGPLENVSFAYQLATGRYCLYLADDDQLDFCQVEEICTFLDANTGLNIVFAPWVCISPSGLSTLFYQQKEKIVSIAKGDYLSLLLFLIKHLALPEIFIFRRQCINLLPMDSPTGQYFLIQVARVIEQTDLIFWSEPFYLQTIHDPKKERNLQGGHVDAMEQWDQYRGGLEIILAKAKLRDDEQIKADFLNAINTFVGIRITIAVRLRLAFQFDTMINNYLLGLRACALGTENQLPLPISSLRKLATMEIIFQKAENLDSCDGIYCDLDLNSHEQSFLNQQATEIGMPVILNHTRDSLVLGNHARTILLGGKTYNFDEVSSLLP